MIFPLHVPFFSKNLSTDWHVWTAACAWWSFQPRVSLGTLASPNSSFGTRRLPNRKARVRVGLPAHSHRNQTGFIISKSWIWEESSKAIRPRFGQPLSFSSSPRGSIQTSMSFLDDSMYVLTLYSLFKYTGTDTDTDSFQHQHYCNEKQLSRLFLIPPNNKLQVQSCVFRDRRSREADLLPHLLWLMVVFHLFLSAPPDCWHLALH